MTTIEHMLITQEVLAQAVSDRGGFNRRQVEALGLTWPLKRGWKSRLLGAEYPEEQVAEFIRLSSRQQTAASDLGSGEEPSQTVPKAAGNWAGLSSPVDIHLYVLALEGGRFYVGLTVDVEQRRRQHSEGVGAEWTKLHRPVGLVRSLATGTRTESEALAIEDEVTVTLMMQHGSDKVRGGRFCHVAPKDLEMALIAHGHWHKIKRREFDGAEFDTQSSWTNALDRFRNVALAWYDAGAPWEQKDRVFASLNVLTRYRYWREGFDAALSWTLWGPKGVLPVLLTFRHGRPVSSGHRHPLEVLDSALNRGRGGRRPMLRLFLLAWRTYQPPVTARQAIASERLLASPISGPEQDRQFDDFVSVLFPEMRPLLQVTP